MGGAAPKMQRVWEAQPPECGGSAEQQPPRKSQFFMTGVAVNSGSDSHEVDKESDSERESFVTGESTTVVHAFTKQRTLYIEP